MSDNTSSPEAPGDEHAAVSSGQALSPAAEQPVVEPAAMVPAVPATVAAAAALNAPADPVKLLPTRVKAFFVAAGVAATGVITFLTAFNIGHWTGAQTALVSTESAAIIGFAAAVTAHFWPDTKQESVALAATFTAMVSATLALGTGFSWWTLTPAQTAALGSLVSGAIGVAGAILARGSVIAKVTGT